MNESLRSAEQSSIAIELRLLIFASGHLSLQYNIILSNCPYSSCLLYFKVIHISQNMFFFFIFGHKHHPAAPFRSSQLNFIDFSLTMIPRTALLACSLIDSTALTRRNSPPKN